MEEVIATTDDQGLGNTCWLLQPSVFSKCLAYTAQGALPTWKPTHAT